MESLGEKLEREKTYQRQEGLREGLKRGEEIGEKRGKVLAFAEVVRRMKACEMSTEEIMQLIPLSREEIERFFETN